MLRTASRIACCAALLVVAASCHKPIPGTLGQPVIVPVRRATTFRHSDLDLYFRRVVSDSRCPAGAQCVSAGEAIVTLDARILKGPVESFDVRLPGGEPSDVPDSIIWKPYDAYRIRLVNLMPVPVEGQHPDSTRYVATLLVQKR